MIHPEERRPFHKGAKLPRDFVAKAAAARRGVEYSDLAIQNITKGIRKQRAEKAARELYHFDLTQPTVAYFWGFAQTDGHLCGNKNPRSNKGRFQIELNYRDADIIYKIRDLFVDRVHVGISNRNRDTNFKNGGSYISLTISNQGFREGLKLLGFPQGKKQGLIIPPNNPFSEKDYVRGLIDGDGSIGFAISRNGQPVISLFTTSEQIAKYYTGFLERTLNIRKNPHRNKRDGGFNITIGREGAVAFANLIYYDGALALNRKMELANLVKQWKRKPSDGYKSSEAGKPKNKGIQ
jgi:hypothetical protein